jgi:nicotinamide-nucleotide amidase
LPKAEIISIGTELLLGQILNTNTQFLSEQLAALGIDCLWHSTVGDNVTRIKEALRAAFNRVDLVITTGGLGPTADDLTTECIAELFKTPLYFDEEVMTFIEHLFKRRGFVMVESNRKQAMRPLGSDLLPNPAGTAPGIVWTIPFNTLQEAGIVEPQRPRHILTFPGVPFEMHAMWKATAAPFLQKTFGSGIIYSIELKHYGIGESSLAEKYSTLLGMTNPTVAPYAGRGECRLRVTAKAKTLEEAKELARPVVERITAESDTLCYGFDDETLESVVGKMLKRAGLKVSFAESCTGGLISKLMTDIPGSSAYIDLNAVTYANQAKQEFLGVPAEILAPDGPGAVSPECAREMAHGIRRLSRADIAVSVTGIAGPDGGTPEKPVGLVYVHLSAHDCDEGKQLKFAPDMDRVQIRHRAASEALNMVRLYLLHKSI